MRGHVQEETGPVAVAPIIEHVVESFQPVAAEHDIELQPEALEPLVLQSTSEAVERIAVNLISNAIKYTPAGGVVRVKCEVQGTMGVLTVADTGCGIAPEDRERIFQPFERVHNEGERIPGSGLGLTIVREQVESHAGRVELVSEPGRGCTFHVYMPLAAGSDAANAAYAGKAMEHVRQEIGSMRRPEVSVLEKSESPPSVPTVLVVEDNSDMRRYVVDVLSTEYRCLEASDGGSAVVTALSELPDVVVCDVMLPVQDGFAVCRALKDDERTSHIPIVLLTALDDPDHKSVGLGELADDYLGKPFGEQELLLRIRNLLHVRELMQRRFARDMRFDRSLPEGLSERDRRFLSRLGDFLTSRYEDPAVDSRVMASALALSERQLQRKLKGLTGMTPSECLRDYRLQRAHERLSSGARVGDVFAASGFASHAHFSACFKARFGHTPREAGAGAAKSRHCTANTELGSS